MKKTLFTATLLAASLMAASTVQAAPQEVTMWHYFDQKPEQEMLADMVEEYNSLQDDIHINATFVSRTELMNQYTVGALSGELPDIGQVDSPDMESYISLGVFEDITDMLSFTQFNFSKGAAVAMVLFACLFLIGLFYLKLLSKEEEES